MKISGNRKQTIVRKSGWKGLFLLLLKKLRSTLPRYRVVVVLSIFFYFAVFLTRLIIRADSIEYLRKFRNEIKDFLGYLESSYDSPLEIFMMQFKRWEERLTPEDFVKSLNKKIKEFEGDPRLADLYFSLSNAYYLAGEYNKHEQCVRDGLEYLKSLRSGSELEKLGIKLLFTDDWGWGIGHCTLLDPLAKLAKLGLLSPQERVIVLSPGDGANRHYFEYWKKYFRFIEISKHEARHLSTLTQPISEKLFGFELKDRCVPLYEACNIAGGLWHEQNREPLLTLTQEDEERGRSMLNKWGIPPDAWFVTLHVREFNAFAPNHLRVRAAPNSDIQTYFSGIQAIIERGGWVIRIGDPSMSEFPAFEGVIDYANSQDRCDWMDVFLCAACKFFIGTSSGPLTLPPTFGVPVLYSNACAIGVSHDLGRSLVLPKLFFSQGEKKLLTFNQILAQPIGWTVRIPDGSGLELRDNTPEEIRDAVLEMFVRLELGPDGFNERSKLQRRFDELRFVYGGGAASTPIADSFAVNHRNLLENSESI
jgi:putative glycosyltransferase (TIGR04372 family)